MLIPYRTTGRRKHQDLQNAKGLGAEGMRATAYIVFPAEGKCKTGTVGLKLASLINFNRL
jgi:hypothetical protein